MASVGSVKKKGGGTPEHLDEVIRNREVIGEERYTEFWRGFNKLKNSPMSERDNYVDAFLDDFYQVPEEEEEEETDFGEPEPPQKRKRRKVVPIKDRTVRASKGWAVRDAKLTGGRVVRVDRFGKVNPRGRSWSAI